MKKIIHLLPALIYLISIPQAKADNQPSGIISGKVINKETRRPVSGVNVFLAYTMAGCASNGIGIYTIKNVPPGNYWLAASHVGYESASLELKMDNNEILTYNFELKPKIYQTAPIVVSAADQAEWQKTLKQFRRDFLGRSDNADLTCIKNEFALEFDRKDRDKYFAYANAPLTIINRALGYKIEYSLFYFESTFSYVKFTGFPLYFPLKSSDPDTLSLWESNRRKTYAGSLRHYLRSICENYELTKGLQEEPEFTVDYSDCTDEGYRIDYPEDNFLAQKGFKVLYKSARFSEAGVKPIISLVNTNKYLKPADSENEMYLKFNNYLEVRYNEPGGGFFQCKPLEQKSWIKLQKDSIIVDKGGRYYETFGIKTYGFWSLHRISDALPYEYNFDEELSDN